MNLLSERDQMTDHRDMAEEQAECQEFWILSRPLLPELDQCMPVSLSHTYYIKTDKTDPVQGATVLKYATQKMHG